MHIYINPSFLRLVSRVGNYRTLHRARCALQYYLVYIQQCVCIDYFVYSSVRVLIPNS